MIQCLQNQYMIILSEKKRDTVYEMVRQIFT